MIRLRSLSVLALIATTSFAAFGREVRADGMPEGTPPPGPAPSAAPAAPSALSRLTPEQRKFILDRIPSFDSRPPAEQEKIAANALRLWAMSPRHRPAVANAAWHA